LSAKDLSAGRTQILNVRRIKTVDYHPDKIVENSALESISDTKHWLNWNRDLDNPNIRKVNCDADNQCDVELDNGIEDLESSELQEVSAAPNVL